MPFLVLYAAATLAMVVFAIGDPERLTLYLLFFLLGLLGTRRHYLRWKRKPAG